MWLWLCLSEDADEVECRPPSMELSECCELRLNRFETLTGLDLEELPATDSMDE